MKAKYRVLDRITELLNQKKQVTTQDIANTMGLSRGVISLYLSQLYKEGLLQKKGTKPVYWLMNSNEDAFNNLIGAEGSLKNVINKCKSAVTYPPNGFPLIITGPSGSGKSYLASLIFKYAQQTGTISKGANFVVLNCADYADNPELLSSALFGYKKGAFTGADENRNGLVDQANGGYLFLDEIHRLPLESQEKLFVLMDSGNFYPLGENEHFKHVNIRFIFATTENIENNLLKTFRRRVPLHVKLTSVSKRPLIEKYRLIEYFFKKEALRIHKDIRVSYDSISDLLSTELIGNVGSLENRIKLLCAECFTQNSTSQVLDIKPINKSTETNDSWLIKSSSSKNLLFDSKNEFNVSLNTLVSRLNKAEKAMNGISNQSLILNQFLRDLSRKSETLIFDVDFTNYIFSKLMNSLKKAGSRYGFLTNLKTNKVKQAAHLLSLFQKCSHKPNLTSLMHLISKKYPRTTYLCSQVSELLDLEVDRSWLIIVLLYVVFNEISSKIEQQELLAIMVCHGGSVASDICSIVNELCDGYIFEAFDMSLDVSNIEIAKQISQYINQQGRNYEGTILLFDMGSLSNLYQSVKPLLNSDLLVINNLTTSVALDLGLQIQRNETFKKIAKKAEDYPGTMNVQYYEGISQKPNIIVSCMSGVGLSEEVKKILERVLKSDIEIITMDYRDLKNSFANHDHSYFKNTNFVLTTNDISNRTETEVLNLYDIMDRDGDIKLRQLLKEMGECKETINELIIELLRFFTIGGIKGRLRFLNPEVVIPEIQEIVAKFEEYYHLDLSGKFKLSLYMHIALMLERLMLDKSGSNEIYEKEISKEEQDFYLVAKNIFHDVENKYNIIISEYELSLIYELFRANQI